MVAQFLQGDLAAPQARAAGRLVLGHGACLSRADGRADAGAFAEPHRRRSDLRSVGGRLVPSAQCLRGLDVPRADGAQLRRLCDRPALRRAGAVLVIRVEGLTKTFAANKEVVAAV